LGLTQPLSIGIFLILLCRQVSDIIGVVSITLPRYVVTVSFPGKSGKRDIVICGT